MELTADTHEAVINLHDVAGVTIQVPELRLKPAQLVHHGAFHNLFYLTTPHPFCYSFAL